MMQSCDQFTSLLIFLTTLNIGIYLWGSSLDIGGRRKREAITTVSLSDLPVKVLSFLSLNIGPQCFKSLLISGSYRSVKWYSLGLRLTKAWISLSNTPTQTSVKERIRPSMLSQRAKNSKKVIQESWSFLRGPEVYGSQQDCEACETQRAQNRNTTEAMQEYQSYDFRPKVRVHARFC